MKVMTDKSQNDSQEVAVASNKKLLDAIERREKKTLWGLAESGKFHLLTDDGYFVCNQAIGVDPYYFFVPEAKVKSAFRNKKVVCQNCLRETKKQEKALVARLQSV